MRGSSWITLATVVGAGVVGVSVAAAALGPFGAWSEAVRVEENGGAHPDFNGTDLDGCPFISRDGKTFFMASNRLTGPTDTVKDINIWVSTREGADDPWSAPTLVAAPVSIDTTSGAPVNDFCPTIDRDGHRFFFVSNRSMVDAFGNVPCGGDDIYVTRLRSDGSIEDPLNLGCGVNTPANEAGPSSLPSDGAGPALYFSSTISGAGDLYRTRWVASAYAGREPVPGVNTAFVEGQPNIRRDGLELFYFSNAPSGIAGTGGNDIWTATRSSTADPFSDAHALGTEINGPAAETRPSLSWDGTTLYFGSTRLVGGANVNADHYVSTRSRG